MPSLGLCHWHWQSGTSATPLGDRSMYPPAGTSGVLCLAGEQACSGGFLISGDSLVELDPSRFLAKSVRILFTSHVTSHDRCWSVGSRPY